MVFLCGLVAWGSKLIKLITLSTTEAEYNALSDSVKLVMYLLSKSAAMKRASMCFDRSLASMRW